MMNMCKYLIAPAIGTFAHFHISIRMDEDRKIMSGIMKSLNN